MRPSISSPCHPPAGNDKTTLERIQCRAISLISGLKGTTYEEKLKELGITTMEERRNQSDMVQMLKILYGYDKSEL